MIIATSMEDTYFQQLLTVQCTTKKPPKRVCESNLTFKWEKLFPFTPWLKGTSKGTTINQGSHHQGKSGKVRENFIFLESQGKSGNLTCFLRFRENQGIVFDPL